MNDSDSTKRALRTLYRKRRDELELTERRRKDQQIRRNLSGFLADHPAKVLLTYMPFSSEPNLVPLIEQLSTREIGLPVVDPQTKAMTFHRWGNEVSMIPNSYGIPEPKIASPVTLAPGSIMLIPALGLDEEGYRLGYGGGYYDRYLASHRQYQLITIGITYEEFVTKAVPRSSHDIPLGFIATEISVRASRRDAHRRAVISPVH